jgi:hypothetical protein
MEPTCMLFAAKAEAQRQSRTERTITAAIQRLNKRIISFKKTDLNFLCFLFYQETGGPSTDFTFFRGRFV